MGGETYLHTLVYKDRPDPTPTKDTIQSTSPPSITPRAATKATTLPASLPNTPNLASTWINLEPSSWRGWFSEEIDAAVQFIRSISLIPRWDVPKYIHEMEPRIIVPTTIGYFCYDWEGAYGGFISADPEKVVGISERNGGEIVARECEGPWVFGGKPYDMEGASLKFPGSVWGDE
ncbi:hypothetical protein BJ508DRAFT_315425 [Ascobolus immersus RN42]|uniref:Uncharacterized protein n=1 Tax=Ascobolus immersus RN42 TaxID=1160509 RepID=A0A3N4HAZ4_ASCIM|nr:hypothetical protein BJ508DRAFT_315425 [Ascobolus immersus RN42]